jgi:hypothetical protein
MRMQIPARDWRRSRAPGWPAGIPARRWRWATGETGLVCSTVVLLIAVVLMGGPRAVPRHGPPVGAPAGNAVVLPDQQESRASWWFPTDVPISVEQTFELRLDYTITSGSKSYRGTERAVFVTQILAPEDGTPGRVVRLHPLKPGEAGAEGDAADGLAQLWISNWALMNPGGLVVTDDSLLVGDAPILHGPWVEGERFTIGGFVAFFLLHFEHVIGFVHFDVQAVTATDVRLTFDFWAGRSGPQVQGDGMLSFAHDKDGITRVEATWQRSLGSEQRRTRLVVTRTGIAPLPGQSGSRSAAHESAPPGLNGAGNRL